MPEDAKEAIGHGVRAKRSNPGAVSFDFGSSWRTAMQVAQSMIGAIAAALAKAQAEITKSGEIADGNDPVAVPAPVATVSLCPALNRAQHLVRKALGRHEIATVQTTAIDNEVGLIRLTTVLALRRVNGCRRIGRSARLARPPRRIAWEPR